MADQQRDGPDAGAGTAGDRNDQGSRTENEGHENSDDSNRDLGQFIQEQHALQMEQQNDEEVDPEKAANFFNRALNESRRMSAEVAKSVERQARLHAELGAENFASWTQEHAQLSLSPSGEPDPGSHLQANGH